MGCDIHTYVEQQDEDGTWQRVEWPNSDRENFIWGPFDWRNYGMFAFLGYDGRNYSKVPPLVELRGLPADVSLGVREAAEDSWDWHSFSWLSADELSGFDYTIMFEDRRVTRGNDGGVTADPGSGKWVTFRDFLHAPFFHDLDVLSAMNEQQPTRVVFWFDN